MKIKTKPTSVRFDKDLLEELDQRCSKVGCSRNDFIKNSVEFAITQTSDFDFGDDEEVNETKEEFKQPQVKVSLVEKEEPEPRVLAHGKILDDYGNVIGAF